MHSFSPQNPVYRLLPLLVLTLLAAACSRPQNLSTFTVTAVTPQVRNLDWIKLSDDPSGDGSRSGSTDGKAFYYHYNAATDTLWFKLELYNEIDREKPAVSVSFDVDADQSTGIPWYGANSDFTFEKMVSVGPTKREGALFRGYNGITNREGVQSRNWINEKQGVIVFYYDEPGRSYYLGVRRSDIDPEAFTLNVIGSVGANALWNDDLADEGHATLMLPHPD